jgi:hypothetical protein
MQIHGSKAPTVETTHSYTTTVVSGDGSFGAEIISFPRYFDGKDAADQVVEAAVELGAVPGALVAPEHVSGMLQQIAFETSGLRSVSLEAVDQVIRAVSEQPIVILEQSPPFGKSLNWLLGEGAIAYVWIIEGKPILAVATGSLLIVVWFVSAPIKGAREGLQEAAHEATKNVATPLLEKWLRRRFRRRRPS